MSCAERTRSCVKCTASRCALLGAPVWRHWLAEGSDSEFTCAHLLRRTEFFLALLFFLVGLGLVCRAHLRTVATRKVSRSGHIPSSIGSTSRYARRHRCRRRSGSWFHSRTQSVHSHRRPSLVRVRRPLESRRGTRGAWLPWRTVLACAGRIPLGRTNEQIRARAPRRDVGPVCARARRPSTNEKLVDFALNWRFFWHDDGVRAYTFSILASCGVLPLQDLEQTWSTCPMCRESKISRRSRRLAALCACGYPCASASASCTRAVRGAREGAHPRGIA